jgi:hypothetical protein
MSDISYTPIETVIDGRVYPGRFGIDRGVIHVVSHYGDRKTQVGGTPPPTLARMILGELVREHLRSI